MFNNNKRNKKVVAKVEPVEKSKEKKKANDEGKRK